MYPNVKIQIEGKGSGTAPPALIAKDVAVRADVAPDEGLPRSDQFEAKHGYKPTQIRTSYDALAVYVSKDNPLEKLTLQQVDAVFSVTRRRGGKDVKTWATSVSPTGPRGPVPRSTAATPPPARTASSRSTCCRRATTVTP
ncbi:MAG: substrate-binding domain-containing protein [Vicinamibacteria bacterium]